jgi:GNAT superfamily N-acetyltransferase
MTSEARIRHVRDGDWDGIVALEAGAYAALGLSEERSALESRVRSSPTTCFVLDVEQRLAAYLLALPYPALQYPDLASTQDTAFRSRNLHLHDLVVAESLRGKGLARRLLRHLTATARSHGYDQISLVAVAGTETFWSANGFTARHGVVAAGSYGPNAVYMSRALPAGGTVTTKPAGGLPRGSSSQDEVG